jgi:hypothetical protein
MNRRLCLSAIALPAGLLAIAAAAATVNAPETWSGGSPAGWLRHDLINERLDPAALTVENGALKLLFTKQSMKTPPEEYVFEATPGASDGKFTGNYLLAGVTEVSFRFYAELPVTASVLLWNEQTRRLWRYVIPDLRTGEWVSVQAPVSLAGLRSVNEVEGAWYFEEDLQNVSWIGVAVRRNDSMTNQTYRLDDFVLKGPGAAFADWMAQFPRPPEYGTGNCNSLPEGDLDGDGMCNFHEWIAGTSAGDFFDRFELTAVGTEDNPSVAGGKEVVVKWKSTPERKYGVWRATTLNGPFTSIGEDLDSTPPENTFRDLTATNDTPYFYRSDVRWPDP